MQSQLVSQAHPLLNCYAGIRFGSFTVCVLFPQNVIKTGAILSQLWILIEVIMLLTDHGLAERTSKLLHL